MDTQPLHTVSDLSRAILASIDERGWKAGSGNILEGPMCVGQHGVVVLGHAGTSRQTRLWIEFYTALVPNYHPMSLATWNDSHSEEEVRAALQALVKS
jgi:hypothetical protein